MRGFLLLRFKSDNGKNKLILRFIYQKRKKFYNEHSYKDTWPFPW